MPGTIRHPSRQPMPHVTGLAASPRPVPSLGKRTPPLLAAPEAAVLPTEERNPVRQTRRLVWSGLVRRRAAVQRTVSNCDLRAPLWRSPPIDKRSGRATWTAATVS